MLLLSWQLTIIMLFGLLSVAYHPLGGVGRPVLKSQRLVAGLLQCRWNSSVAFALFRHSQGLWAQSVLWRNLKLLQASNQSRRIQASIEPVSEGVATIMFIGMLILAFVLIPNGQLQSAELLTFLFVLLRIMPIRQLDGVRVKISTQGPLSSIKSFCELTTKLTTKWFSPVFGIAASHWVCSCRFWLRR